MNGKIIAVCGGAGAGKTTVCVNLAAALGEDNVVIVFGTRTDYPSLQSFFNVAVPDGKGVKKLYEDISMDLSVDIKDYLVQYQDSNIFMLTVPDSTKVLTFADTAIIPPQQQCKNILLSLRELCDYLIIDCDTDINNHMSAWGLNYADKIINVVKPTQQGLRFVNAYQQYYNEIWRGEVVYVVNGDKNYIGIKEFEKATDARIHFDAALPYDEQTELAENTGVPVFYDYHRVKMFQANYRARLLELADMITEE